VVSSPGRQPLELCDRALLLAYASVAGFGDYLNASVELLNHAVAGLTASMPTGLFSGLAGVGWTVEHVGRMLGLCDSDTDPLEAVDQAVVGRLGRKCWVGPYDLIGGLVGIGIYFLERLPRRTAMHGIELTIRHLEQQAEHTPAGISWFTRPELLPEDQRESSPNGYYNLGVAHGLPAVAGFLGELVAADIESTRAQRMLKGLMHWLFAHRQGRGAIAEFSNWIAPGGTPYGGSRVAWCYGDLGVGALIYRLGIRFQNQDWLRSAQRLLDGCLDRSDDRVRDPGLCHGALGVAHVYNRAYQLGGDVRYRQAAEAYYSRGIAMADYPDNSFLEGRSGGALALISAVAPVNPHWDRKLLLSGVS
jgi:hypothetical protein